MTNPPSGREAGAFRDFELAGWEAIPDLYDDAFSALTSQSAEPLLDVTRVGRDTQVLDVATGPGHVAAAAAARGARVIGLDFSPAMVERAKLRFPQMEFCEGDAESLPFEAGRFDAVTMNFGLLHLTRPELALSEAHRVLRSGGHFGFTVWATPDQAVGFGAVLRAIAAHGTLDVPLPDGPPFFRFSDPQESLGALRAAGFTDERVETIPQSWRLRSEDDLCHFMLNSTVRTAGLLRSQSPEASAQIRAALAEEVRRYPSGDGFVLSMPAILASAVRP